MFTYFQQCGPIGWPLLIITIANIVLAIRNAVRIAGAKPGDGPRVTNANNTILFWGAVAAVMGFLGQYTGIYNALGAIIQATKINPNLVMEGFRQSFTTTLWGLNLLVWSAVAWAVLNGWHRRSAARLERATAAE
jgi:biopolymer transport protein ExbB/TolQ